MPMEGRPPWVPDREDIERVAGEIGEKFHPEKVILFGSYAYGTATDDSDVDLLVVMETEGRPLEMAARILCEVPRRFPLDLLVRTPHDVAYRIALGDWFLKEITEKGEVLYERTHARVAHGGSG